MSEDQSTEASAGQDRPTVGLVMIVKNETTALPRMAATVIDKIDYWTIVDTGSTDGTQELVKELFASVPGHLIQDEWRGFGASRNVALHAAEDKTDWLLFMDADQELVGNFDHELLAGPWDTLELEERTFWERYFLLRLARGRAGWEWRGRTHEYLALKEGRVHGTRMFTCHVLHHADGGNRIDKFERDLRLLAEDWDEKHDDRTAFYLARTNEDLRRTEEAVEWYRRRIDMGGWDEERFFSRWRLGNCLMALERWDEAVGVLWHAWGERPWRAEPLVTLSHYYRTKELWVLSWNAVDLCFRRCVVDPDGQGTVAVVDHMFVDAASRTWAAAFEGQVTAWHIGEFERGWELSRYLLTIPDLPPNVKRAIDGNAALYAEKLERPYPEAEGS